MPLVIPLAAVPSQSLQVTLASQVCNINVYQKTAYDPVVTPAIFLDLYLGTTPVINGTLCHDGICLVRDLYLGFIGDLAFYDTQGSDDPQYTGFGSRWFLAYLSPAEVIEQAALG